MPFVDDNGNPVDPAKVAADLRSGKGNFESYPVTPTVGQAGSRVAALAERNIPPLVAQGVGQTLGGFGGAALGGPIGGAIGEAAGAGIGNVLAGKGLPSKWGGSPTETIPSLFAWGAGPAAVGRVGGKALEARGLRKSAEAAQAAQEQFESEAETNAKALHKRVAEVLSPQGATPETVEQVKQLIGKSVGAPYAIEATSSPAQRETFETRDAVLGPINRLRDKFGAPLNLAYKSLKGGERVSEQEAIDLADAAQGVRDALVSPAPRAASALARLKSYRPPPMGLDVNAILQGKRKLTMSNEEWAAIEATHEQGGTPTVYEPPTLDELRELRQEVNTRLRTAEGGDAHALRDLQQALDEKLLPHLPANIQAMRGDYAHFMNNYPWREIRSLRRAGVPAQMSDWLFDKKSPQTLDVIRTATPDERNVYRRMFYNHVLSGVDEKMPAEQQMAQLIKNTEPYRRNGVARALFGAKSGDTLDTLIYLPKHIADFGKMWTDPAKQRVWMDDFMRAAKTSGKVDREAAEAGLDAWMNSLSPAQQRAFKQIALPLGTPEPVELPTAQQKLVEQIHEKAASSKISVKMRLGWAVPMGLAGAVMGRKFGVAYSASVVASIGMMLATQEAYKAFVRNGGADLIANLYATEGGRMSGAAVFRAFALLGGRLIHEKVNAKANTEN